MMSQRKTDLKPHSSQKRQCHSYSPIQNTINQIKDLIGYLKPINYRYMNVKSELNVGASK